MTSLLVEDGTTPLGLQRGKQCLRYLNKIESNQHYNGGLNVLSDYYDSDYSEDNNHIVPIGTRVEGMKWRLNLQSDYVPIKLPETPPWLLKAVDIC